MKNESIKYEVIISKIETVKIANLGDIFQTDQNKSCWRGALTNPWIVNISAIFLEENQFPIWIFQMFFFCSIR